MVSLPRYQYRPQLVEEKVEKSSFFEYIEPEEYLEAIQDIKEDLETSRLWAKLQKKKLKAATKQQKLYYKYSRKKLRALTKARRISKRQVRVSEYIESEEGDLKEAIQRVEEINGNMVNSDEFYDLVGEIPKNKITIEVTKLIKVRTDNKGRLEQGGLTPGVVYSVVKE